MRQAETLRRGHMETLQEQIEYGSRCVHGTALGTPGGADLMCGRCELGLTRWVSDPSYRLWWSVDDRAGNGSAPAPVTTIRRWYQSELDSHDDPKARAQLESLYDRLTWWVTQMTNGTPKTLTFTFWVEIDETDGYWAEPVREEPSYLTSLRDHYDHTGRSS